MMNNTIVKVIREIFRYLFFLLVCVKETTRRVRHSLHFVTILPLIDTVKMSTIGIDEEQKSNVN